MTEINGRGERIRTSGLLVPNQTAILESTPYSAIDATEIAETGGQKRVIGGVLDGVDVWMRELDLSPPYVERGRAADLPGFLYRARFDEYERQIEFHALPIVKRTPRGNWVMDWKRRFVLASGMKRYAYPTHQEALLGFIHRKRKQIAILSTQHDRAVEALAVAEETLKLSSAPSTLQAPAPQVVGLEAFSTIPNPTKEATDAI